MFTQPEPTDFNWIKLMYSIVKRFVALRGPTDFTTPLAIYRNSSGVVNLLVAADVEIIMSQEAAKCMIWTRPQRQVKRRYSFGHAILSAWGHVFFYI